MLADGTPYYTVHFSLYADSFRVRDGVSMSGVYMLYLTLPTWARSDTNAVRVVSIVPPKLSPDVVLESVAEDILRSAADGVVCISPDGKKHLVYPFGILLIGLRAVWILV